MTIGKRDPDTQVTDYYPEWLDNLADDVTLEGSAMDGLVQGTEAVRIVLVSLYDFQHFSFVGLTARGRCFVEPGSGPSRRHVIGHDKPGGRDVAFKDRARIIAVNTAAVRAAAWPER